MSIMPRPLVGRSLAGLSVLTWAYCLTTRSGTGREHEWAWHLSDFGAAAHLAQSHTIRLAALLAGSAAIALTIVTDPRLAALRRSRITPLLPGMALLAVDTAWSTVDPRGWQWTLLAVVAGATAILGVWLSARWRAGRPGTARTSGGASHGGAGHGGAGHGGAAHGHQADTVRSDLIGYGVAAACTAPLLLIARGQHPADLRLDLLTVAALTLLVATAFGCATATSRITRVQQGVLVLRSTVPGWAGPALAVASWVALTAPLLLDSSLLRAIAALSAGPVSTAVIIISGRMPRYWAWLSGVLIALAYPALVAYGLWSSTGADVDQVAARWPYLILAGLVGQVTNAVARQALNLSARRELARYELRHPARL